MVGPVRSRSVARGLMYRTGSMTCHEMPRKARPKMKLAGRYVENRRKRSSWRWADGQTDGTAVVD